MSGGLLLFVLVTAQALSSPIMAALAYERPSKKTTYVPVSFLCRVAKGQEA